MTLVNINSTIVREYFLSLIHFNNIVISYYYYIFSILFETSFCNPALAAIRYVDTVFVHLLCANEEGYRMSRLLIVSVKITLGNSKSFKLNSSEMLVI